MSETFDSRQMKAFVVLAKTGSYSETAKQLFVTHSAICHSMRALETQAGCRLFTKLRKKITLTEAGEALLHHANRLLKEMQQARSTLNELNQWGSKRLRLAADSILCSTILAPALPKFKEEFPKTRLHIQKCNPADVLKRLEHNQVDIALSVKPPANSQFEFTPLFADRFHLVVNSSHPLAKSNRVTRTESSKHSCILFSDAGQEHKQVENFLIQSDITPNVAGEIECLETVKTMVAKTNHMSLLPGWVISNELKSKTFITLPTRRKPLEQIWGIIHSRNYTLNHAESTLIKLCKKQVGNL